MCVVVYIDNIQKQQVIMDSVKQLDMNASPQITDVEWKLEVLTNTPGTGSDKLLYVVVLKTNAEDIRFTCDTQQLQDLVYKLKDLVRHCETVKSELS